MHTPTLTRLSSRKVKAAFNFEASNLHYSSYFNLVVQ